MRAAYILGAGPHGVITHLVKGLKDGLAASQVQGEIIDDHTLGNTPLVEVTQHGNDCVVAPWASAFETSW